MFFNMKFELPEFKRCCFCLPLRYGLITWGYIRLIVTLLLILSITYDLVLYIMIFNEIPAIIMPDIIMEGTVLLFLTLDVCMTVMFLVGGHKKNAKFLHIFKVFNIVILCIITTAFLLTTAFGLYLAARHSKTEPDLYLSIAVNFCAKMLIGLFTIGIQMYIILLIRSEINKLRNNSEFRFTNIASEATCVMNNEINTQCNGKKDHKIGTYDLNNGSDDDLKTVIYSNGTDTDFERTVNGTINNKPGSFNYSKF